MFRQTKDGNYSLINPDFLNSLTEFSLTRDDGKYGYFRKELGYWVCKRCIKGKTVTSPMTAIRLTHPIIIKMIDSLYFMP